VRVRSDLHRGDEQSGEEGLRGAPTQFFASQEDPEKNNPLLEVALPEVSEEQLNTMLLSCGTDGRLVVGAYLYAGNYREAMIAAQD